MVGEYTDEELARLHDVLYEILGEVKRVCEKLGIPYSVIGGSAIGAYFWNGIIPWDDDIDVGLTRENYERFMREAPNELGEGFFLQTPDSDPRSIYYFCKLMKRGTLFQEADLVGLPVQQGIYIDIFPYDKVSDNKALQKAHRILCNFFNCAFMAKERWRWKHFGRCEIAHPTNRGALPCLMTRITVTLMSKKRILKTLNSLLGLFNSWNTKYYNLVLYPRDHIAVEDVENLQSAKFGSLTVPVPDHLETYLRHHYPRLRKHIPKEEQMNHHPYKLEFDTREGQ